MRARLIALSLACAAFAGLALAQETMPEVMTPQAPPAPAPSPVPAEAPASSLTPPVIGETPPVVETPDEATEEEEKPKAATRKAEPAQRGRSTVAILQALDKVTAETLRFEAQIGRPVRYKTLVFTVRACESAASDETVPEAAAYVIVDSHPKGQPGRTPPPARQVFKGWMYASSPGLMPMQHPVYDAWLIACRTTAPSASAVKR